MPTFAFDMYQQLRAGDAGNLIFSPHSVSTALAMTYAGARTETEAEMAAVLHFTLPQEKLHPAFNALDQALAMRNAVKLKDGENGAPPELHVANAIWPDKDYRFLDEYLDPLALNYGAGLQLLDFQNDSDGSRKVINSWVEDQTKDRIKNLIPAGAIDNSTRLVLTNTVYFNASWETPFDAKKTATAPFTLLDGSHTNVSTMHISDPVGARYARVGSLQAVELPYLGNEIAMLILLPNEGKFADVEASLNAELLAEVIADLRGYDVNLALPKFKFEWEQSLTDPLKNLGMASAFEVADFSGMDGTQNLVISDVLHKAFISVDERGTEAAAATAVLLREISAPPHVEVAVDRPFIFLIRDRPTGAILFLGRVTAPSE